MAKGILKKKTKAQKDAKLQGRADRIVGRGMNKIAKINASKKSNKKKTVKIKKVTRKVNKRLKPIQKKAKNNK
mgnify:CR=1 FL=1|tara:strand:+ start:2582 stop:2800 length:219 start_codon:yes stop_codon:yes gene_type:complete